MREEASDAPGLVLTDADDVYLVREDGSRVLVASGAAFNGGTITEQLIIAPGTTMGPLILTAPAGTDALEMYDDADNLLHYFDSSGGAQIGGGDGITGLTVGSTTERVRVQPASGDNAFRVSDLNGAVQLEVKTAALGFFGHTPVARPVVPLTTPTVQNVIDALVALGLVVQHD